MTCSIRKIVFAGAPQDKKGVDGDVDGEKKEITAESKNAKKKKKKDKASKEVKESNGQPNTSDVENAEEDSSVVDVKERLKKVASMRKKKSSKEMDAAARAAAQEAAARNAKKKEKNHYNQQPVR
jgi:hypothetical protein